MSTKSQITQNAKSSLFKQLPTSDRTKRPWWPEVPKDYRHDIYLQAVWWVLQITAEMAKTLETLDLGSDRGPAAPAYKKARAVLAADRALLEFWLNTARKAKGGPYRGPLRPRLVLMQEALQVQAEQLRALCTRIGPSTSAHIVRALESVIHTRTLKGRK